VILLSVYCTKTAIDIFTFYRFIFLHCLSCVCQLFLLKIMMMMMMMDTMNVSFITVTQIGLMSFGSLQCEDRSVYGFR